MRGFVGAVRAGYVEFVSSDHVVWPFSRKTNEDMFAAGPGVPGLETLLPAFYPGVIAKRGTDCVAVACQPERMILGTMLGDDPRAERPIDLRVGDGIPIDNTMAAKVVGLARWLEQLFCAGGVFIQSAAHKTLPTWVPFDSCQPKDRAFRRNP